LPYTSSIAVLSTVSSTRFLKAVSVRKTRLVKRGSRVETARSMRVVLDFISSTGVAGGGRVVLSSSFFFSPFALSAGFISTSAIIGFVFSKVKAS
jgi:hypothetical protein